MPSASSELTLAVTLPIPEVSIAFGPPLVNLLFDQPAATDANLVFGAGFVAPRDDLVVLASLPQLQAAAQGQALVSIDQGAVVRRVPLVAAIGSLVTPSLAMEMLRVGYNDGPITVRADAHGIKNTVLVCVPFARRL